MSSTKTLLSQADCRLIEEIFDAGVADVGSRQQLLEEKLAGRPDLSERVQRLWFHHDTSSRPPQAWVHLCDISMQALVAKDDEIKYLEKEFDDLDVISHGPMGDVYKAVEREVSRRRVAIKILPTQWGSPNEQARFREELTVLGMMQHHNIGGIYYTRELPNGSPYVVMEYLQGQNIIDYCDGVKLSIQERVVLFQQALKAVTHIHNQRLIHRDLKPGNIMVVEREGGPRNEQQALVKIIDFGLAHNFNPFSGGMLRFAALDIAGTPQYMSPEQAGPTAHLGVHVDIYGLGAVLYQLLVGIAPLAPFMRDTKDLSGVLEIIQRKKPFALINCLGGAEAVEVAAKRNTSVHRLKRILRGDLQAIVTKALAKDPANRYASVHEMAEDLERYLTHRTVRAASASWSYAIAKYLRRNMLPLIVSTTVLLVLGCSTAAGLHFGFSAGEAKIQAERALSRQQAVNDFILDIFKAAGSTEGGQEVRAVTLLDKAALTVGDQYRNNPKAAAPTQMALGRAYQGLGLYEKALTQYEEAERLFAEIDGPNSATQLEAMRARAYMNYSLGRMSQATGLYMHSWQMAKKYHGPDHLQSWVSAASVAFIWGKDDNLREAEKLFETSLQNQIKMLGESHPITVKTCANYAQLLRQTGKSAQALPLLRSIYRRRLRHLGPSHHETLITQHNLADALVDLGRASEAETLLQDLVDRGERVLGPQHPNYLKALNRLAMLYADTGRGLQGAQLLATLFPGEVLAIEKVPRQRLGMAANLAHCLIKDGQLERAQRLLTAILDRQRREVGELAATTLLTTCTLGEVLMAQQRWREAASLFIDLVGKSELLDSEARQDDRALFRGLLGLCMARNEQRQAEEAKELLSKALLHLGRYQASYAARFNEELAALE